MQAWSKANPRINAAMAIRTLEAIVKLQGYYEKTTVKLKCAVVYHNQVGGAKIAHGLFSSWRTNESRNVDSIGRWIGGPSRLQRYLKKF